MIHIAILDDDLKQTAVLHDLMDSYCEQREIRERRIHIFHEGRAFLRSIAAIAYDFLLLDIEIGEENGIDIAKEIRKSNDAMVIFVITNYLRYSVDGYRIQAARYLLKPVVPQLLFSELDEVLRLEERSAWIVENHEERYRIRKRDVLYIESEGRKVRIHTLQDSYLDKDSLHSWFHRLDDTLFVECHKGILVHVRYIRSLQKDTLLLESGVQLPLARRKAEHVRQCWLAYQEKFI